MCGRLVFQSKRRRMVGWCATPRKTTSCLPANNRFFCSQQNGTAIAVPFYFRGSIIGESFCTSTRRAARDAWSIDPNGVILLRSLVRFGRGGNCALPVSDDNRLEGKCSRPAL